MKSVSIYIVIVRFAVAVLLCAPATALGFADSAQFLAQSNAATLTASSEGLYFTGAPRFSRLTCRECHTGGPGSVKMNIISDSPSLFADGYSPGQTYRLQVMLDHESLGLAYDGTSTCTEPNGTPYVQCNNNNFALEIDAASKPLSAGYCAAPPVGGSCPSPAPDDEVLVAPGGDAVFGARGHDPADPSLVLRNDATQWQLWWTAPPTGSGTVTLYASAVDGNGGTGRADLDQDPFGDDAVTTTLTLPEIGAPLTGSSTGCSAAEAAPYGASLLFAVVAAALLMRRRLSRLLMLALLCLAACEQHGPDMTPGQDCLAGNCHRRFSLAGTIFAHADSLTTEGIEGAQVVLTDSQGRTLQLDTNSAGNFWTSEPLALPLVVEVHLGDQVRHMGPLVDRGSCNNCHGAPPANGAAGLAYAQP